MFQDTVHHLSSKQMAFLNRGPTYVSPCQVHLLSKSSLTLAQIVTRQMVPLRRQLTKLFSRYPIDLARRMNFEREIQQLFNQSFVQSIPSSLEVRAYEEQQLIRSIQYQLKKDQLILQRTADDCNTYYLGRQDEFHRKTMDYVENSTCYEFYAYIDETNSEQTHLNTIIKSIDSQLEQLHQRKLINKDHLSKFSIGKRTNLKLPHLYFLPETNEDVHMVVQPRMSSYRQSPIQYLADYLDQLLRPMFENVARSTFIFNSGDFMHKLHTFCGHFRHFHGRTHFATFKIHDLYTRISHSSLIQGIEALLANALLLGRHQGLTNEAIAELVGIVLRNNFFSFHSGIYRFVKGCPFNLPLTLLLGNIYLHDWQAPLLTQVRLSNAFYGRFNNSGFLTWNRSLEQLESLFERLEQWLASELHLTWFVDQQTRFLDAYIENREGFLHTRVSRYRTPSQLFVLPYTSGHPRLFHRKWFRFALKRAGQYCDRFEDFEDERRYIELTYLANGYSLDFVEAQVRQFINKFLPVQYQRTGLNRHTYYNLRPQLFATIDQQKRDLEDEQRLRKNHQYIELYYLFDWGCRHEFNEKFYQLWMSTLNEDPVFKKYGLKIKLTSKHCYLSNKLLARSIKHT